MTETDSHDDKKISKRKKTWIIVGIIILIIILLVALSARSGKDGDKTPTKSVTTSSTTVESVTTSSTTVEKRKTNTLTWEAETSGENAISVTYTTKDMNVSQETNVASPWAKDIQVKSKYDLLGASVSAQNTGSGDVTCRAKWNGRVISENTSSGELATARCAINFRELDSE